jgi:hypothetical protein
MKHALIFFCGKAVLGDDLGGDAGFGHAARLEDRFRFVERQPPLYE